MAAGATHTAMPPPATSHPGSTPLGELFLAPLYYLPPPLRQVSPLAELF